jgi:DNA (cytosine-5)-methyltransferase 1
MSVLWQAEVDEWCRRVLRWHWPDAEIYDDVRGVGKRSANLKPNLRGDRSSADPSGGKQSDKGRDGWPPSVDLLCGGFPCQDLSVAGKRAGLAGERSGLFFEFARIADELRPTWLLVENVVGLLSSANGRDMGVVLSTLAEIGYGLSWRVVDARYFGVPQRRRRVFIVGRFGDNGERAVRALGTGGEGDLEAGRCSWQDAAGGVGAGAEGAGGVIANTLQVTCGDYSRADGFNMVAAPAMSFAQNQRCELRESPVAARLTTGGGKPGEGYPAVRVLGQNVSKPLLTNAQGGLRTTDLEGGAYVGHNASSVRRLTPTECERLMSWPDGWTAVDGDKTPDSRRYAACGNGVVSNVAEWIGRRIMAVENE